MFAFHCSTAVRRIKFKIKTCLQDKFLTSFKSTSICLQLLHKHLLSHMTRTGTFQISYFRSLNNLVQHTLIVTSNKVFTSERNMTIFEHFNFYNAVTTAQFHCHLRFYHIKYQRAFFRPCVAVLNSTI